MTSDKSLFIQKSKFPVKAVTAVSIVFITAAVILFAVYLANTRESVIENASAYIEASACTSADSSARYFYDRLDALERCANEAGTTSPEAMQALLSRYCVDRLFEKAAFVSVDGGVITSDDVSPGTVPKQAAQQAFGGGSAILPGTETTISRDLYTVPVYGADGALIGSLVAGAPPAALSDMIFSSDFSVSGSYFIVSESGRVLFTDGSTDLLLKGDNVLSILENGKNDVNGLKTALNQRNVSGVCKASLNGEDYLFAYASMPGRNWTILLTAPIDPIIEMSMPMFIPSILIVIGTIIIFIALAVYTVLITKKAQQSADGIIENTLRRFYEDSVTGFSSWQKFLEDYTAQIKDTSQSHALISLDIDKFKAVNDIMGFDGGNTVLKQIAEIISRNIGKNDMFARSSADRFYILIGHNGESELVDFARRVISDIEYQVTSAKITISIGIYPITDRSINAYTASDRADLARGSVKNDKESTFNFFDSSMLESIRAEHYIENIMDSALERQEFIVYLQPKFGLDSVNEVTGAEALVRWKHNGQLISPGQFIPLFERNGFVTKLDLYMFGEVCRLQKKWLSQGKIPKIISVNMSRAHLRNPNFVQQLKQRCDEFQIDPKYFEIEITESAAFENIDILMTVFTQIKEAGFHVSIDDFGTGYSSLNMLKDLPVDVLKIDRSFLTEDASETENASKIIGCVVSLATSLNISTICEGIETKEQASLLTKLGCNMAQGFFFARPMPVAEYENLVYSSVS